jgi:hypothetical protein
MNLKSCTSVPCSSFLWSVAPAHSIARQAVSAKILLAAGVLQEVSYISSVHEILSTTTLLCLFWSLLSGLKAVNFQSRFQRSSRNAPVCFAMSICYNSSRPAERFSWNLILGATLVKFVHRFRFWLKWDNNGQKTLGNPQKDTPPT